MPDRRPALLDRFRESSDIRVLLSTEAGGAGLNLQCASYVVHGHLVGISQSSRCRAAWHERAGHAGT
jgi:hypothetical protein